MSYLWIALLATSACAEPAPPVPEPPARSRTTSVIVAFEPDEAFRTDLPTATVTSVDRIIAGVPVVLRVDVMAPPTFSAAPNDPSYNGFNPEYPMRLALDSGAADVTPRALTGTQAEADHGVHWSARRVGFEVTLTPRSAGHLELVAHLRFGLCSENAYTQRRVSLALSLAVAEAAPAGR